MSKPLWWWKLIPLPALALFVAACLGGWGGIAIVCVVAGVFAVASLFLDGLVEWGFRR